MCDCRRWSCKECGPQMYWKDIGRRRTIQQKGDPIQQAIQGVERRNRVADRQKMITKYRWDELAPIVEDVVTEGFNARPREFRHPVKTAAKPVEWNMVYRKPTAAMDEPVRGAYVEPASDPTQSAFYLAMHGPEGHWAKVAIAEEAKRKNAQELLNKEIMARYNSPKPVNSPYREKKAAKQDARRAAHERKMAKVKRDLFSSVNYDK